MTKDTRKYPCEAKYVIHSNRMPDLKGQIVTVLEEAKYRNCCCGITHPIELPDSFPDPPEGCDTWMVKPTDIEFI